MKLRRLAVAALLLCASAAYAEAAPKRRVIDRIVAVVDDACITQSELARFMAPHEKELARALAGKPAERAAATARLRDETLQALIERRLVVSESDRQHLEVSPVDVDAALQAVAGQNGISVADLLRAAKEQGLDEAHYRGELRVQILEAKLLQVDAARRFPDWKDLTAEARVERLGKGRLALLGELRAKSFIEIRH